MSFSVYLWALLQELSNLYTFLPNYPAPFSQMTQPTQPPNLNNIFDATNT